MSATRYDAVAVRKYTDGQGNEKSQFTTVGVAFPMRDRDGFSVKLHAIPAPVDGEYTLLLMPPKPRDDNRSSGQSRGDDRGSRGGSYSQSMDDEIPFAPEWR